MDIKFQALSNFNNGQLHASIPMKEPLVPNGEAVWTRAIVNVVNFIVKRRGPRAPPRV
jgi:hypothetical protein